MRVKYILILPEKQNGEENFLGDLEGYSLDKEGKNIETAI